MAASVKMTAIWDIAPCSLVEVDNVSEVLTSSIVRAIACFYESTRRNPRRLSS
jgi:hypothetical protein